MRFGRKIQITLLCFSSLIFFYSYYYLPGKNEGSIKVKSLPSKESEEKIKNKNTFTNVEYKSQNSDGQIFTTEAEESSVDPNKPELINLINPYSVTKLKKDNTSCMCTKPSSFLFFVTKSTVIFFLFIIFSASVTMQLLVI